MTKEELLGFESAVDFVLDRVGKIDDVAEVRELLEKLANRVTSEKVQRIEEFLALGKGRGRAARSGGLEISVPIFTGLDGPLRI